jgi:aryl-alcohol dehydrogenase-like predicted oxidoreductase
MVSLMKYRTLGKTGFQISEISLGAWQIGGGWGKPFSFETADRIIQTALDHGVNFIDTADVYDGGLSEQAVGKAIKKRSERVYVATKCGRQLNPHSSDSYTPLAMRKFVEQSLLNLGVETLDLIQLHCPPNEVFYRPEIFQEFMLLQQEGKIQHLGVSVEKVEQALKAIEYPNVTTVLIIYNMFRQRPHELFFPQAKLRDVGIIVRVPLASGLLSGKFSETSQFGKEDHRNFNREGAAFDKGETFAGVDFTTGLVATKKLKQGLTNRASLAQAALRWILDRPEVSCVIPGASRPEQALDNMEASSAQPFSSQENQVVNQVYTDHIKPLVHHLW